MGVSKAPRGWKHQGVDILVPRFFALPDHPYSATDRLKHQTKNRWVEKKLGSWRPDLIVCHTLWPVAQLAERLAARWEASGLVWFTAMTLMSAPAFDGVGPRLRDSGSGCAALVCASDRLSAMAKSTTTPPKRVETIPCVTSIHKEWRRPIHPMKKRGRRSRLTSSFLQTLVAQKNVIFYAPTGEVPCASRMDGGHHVASPPTRDIVYDRMLTV